MIRNRKSSVMSNATRMTKSFSLEKKLLKEVERTRGSVSTNERVNQLLKAGLEAERRQSLHAEASGFFKSDSAGERQARRTFQSASIESITRES